MLPCFNMVVPKLFDLTLGGGSMGGGDLGNYWIGLGFAFGWIDFH